MFFSRNLKFKFINYSYKLEKSGVTSGGSRLKFEFKRKLPFLFKFKRLTFCYRNNAGRSHWGRIVMFSKKKRQFKKRVFSINYSFRLKFLSFVGSIFMLPYSHKLISMVFLSSGSITYLPTSYNNKLFSVTKMYPIFEKIRVLQDKISIINPKFFIAQGYFFIKYLPKNQHVCLLELVPGEGIKYVRSPGTSARINKIDISKDTALVKLPSGVRKMFSACGLGSAKQNPYTNNKYWKSNKAGYYSSYGKKPKVRGVAKNPIDHPHGGRTKAISYQRTPWGKTAKFK